MNEKEIAERLRHEAAEMRMHGYPEAAESIEAFAYELDPPMPEPGLVTYQSIHDKEPLVGWWDGKKLRDYATGRIFAETALDTLNMKPARILAPDEVAVKVPPTDEWPRWASNYYAAFIDGGGRAPINETIITRAEAEEMHRE